MDIENEDGDLCLPAEASLAEECLKNLLRTSVYLVENAVCHRVTQFPRISHTMTRNTSRIAVRCCVKHRDIKSWVGMVHRRYE